MSLGDLYYNQLLNAILNIYFRLIINNLIKNSGLIILINLL